MRKKDLYHRSNIYDSFFYIIQIPYIETSAKDPPLNVDAAFHEVVKIIRLVCINA